MSKDRMDRFIWQEGEVEMYDKDGNRLDPKTMKLMTDVDGSGELKKLLDAAHRQ